MKQVTLSGSPRESVGRQGASALRHSERIPGVLYGGKEQVHFSVSEIALKKIIHQPDTLRINLELNGKTYPTIIQEVQFHPVTDRVLHFDLLELIPGKPVKTALPLRITGTSEGVRSGGKLVVNYRKLRIKGTPEVLPEAIVVDITPLKIGDMIRVRDIQYEGCEVLEAEASMVVGVQVTRAVVEEAAPSAAAAPAAAPAAAAPAADKKK